MYLQTSIVIFVSRSHLLEITLLNQYTVITRKVLKSRQIHDVCYATVGMMVTSMASHFVLMYHYWSGLFYRLIVDVEV